MGMEQHVSIGDFRVSECQYHSISFSDQLSLRVSYALPNMLARNLAPQIKPAFKIPPSVVTDKIFKQQLENSMAEWLQVKEAGADLMLWWDLMVKGGIKYLPIQRGKELEKQNIGILNMLKLKQAYFTSRVQNNVQGSQTELATINAKISEWYKRESEKISLMSWMADLNQSEKVRIYHHGQHNTNSSVNNHRS